MKLFHVSWNESETVFYEMPWKKNFTVYPSLYIILITLEIPTSMLRWLSLRKFCFVNIHNINVNKIAKVLKESIDIIVRTEW